MLWGKKYQSRYEVATAFGIREISISARIHTRNRTLEEIVLELLQKEPICFEGKSYNTLVELCAEYQVQPCNVFERLKYGKTLEEAIYLPIRNNGKRYEIEYEGKENNLLELIAADPAFPMGLEELKASMDPSKYIGRSKEQVEAFLKNVIHPILEANKDLLGVKAEINV